MKIFYKTPMATSTGGRAGHVALDDGSLGFDLQTPEQNSTGVNPEKLFAMGYAACFDNALTHEAQRMKLEGVISKTSAVVGLGMNTQGGYALDIDLYVELGGVSEEQAQALVETTDKVCPYSNAVRGNVEVRLHTKVVA